MSAPIKEVMPGDKVKRPIVRRMKYDSLRNRPYHGKIKPPQLIVNMSNTEPVSINMPNGRYKGPPTAKIVIDETHDEL